jgi:hypothetical protein
MADTEDDEEFQDVSGGEDDEQPKKTRKTAGGRVIIESKEGESYQALHEMYCVLHGADPIDAERRGHAARGADAPGDGRAAVADMLREVARS